MAAHVAPGSLGDILRRNRDFRLFWAGNLVSSSGVWMQNLAQGWLILELSDSPFLLGAAGFVSLAPTLVLSVVGGTIADRIDRRRILVGTHLALMLLAFVLGALTQWNLVSAGHILVIILLSGVATALNSPAYQATIPDLVPPPDLTGAIALNAIQFNVARVAGHSAAGLLVASAGAATCFYVNGITYLAMLYALARMEPFSRHRRGDVVPFWSRFKEGLEYVGGRRTVRYAIGVVGFVSFLGLPYYFLLPAVGRDVLHQDAAGVGFLMGSVSLGALVGAVVMTPIVHACGPRRTAGMASVCFWFTLAFFAVSRAYWLSIALLLVLGFSLVLTVAAVNNLLQATTGADMRGRVMGVYGMALNGLAPVGGLLAGALAEAYSTAWAVGGMACAGLVGSAFLAAHLMGENDGSLREA